MSTLLDSLRQAKQAGAAPPSGGGARQVDAILSTLGYARRQRRARFLRIVAGVVVVGLVGVIAWVVWNRPPSTPEGIEGGADLTVADAASSPPAALTEGEREPVAPSVTPVDPNRAVAPDLTGDLAPRAAPDITAPVASPDPTSPGVGVETRPLPEEQEEPAVVAVDDEPGPPSGLSNDPDPRAAESTADEPDALPDDALGIPVAPAATPLAPGDVAPPTVPFIERGPVVSVVFAEALALQRAGDIGGAMSEYEGLLFDGARSAQVHNNLGLLYQEESRSDDAAQQFQLAIAIDPRYSKAHNNLGVVRMGQARYEDAAMAFRDARRLDATNLDAWVNQALALQAAGDVAAAKRTLVDALSVDARHGPTHYNLARLFELAGDISRAVEHYERFVENSGAEHAALVDIVRGRIAALGGRVSGLR
jgi:Tfp pilus assembly protein PilF